MENPRTFAFAQTAQTIIKQLERRNMEGYFCETSADAVELVRKLVPAGASIAWGGTETFKETGVKSMLEAGDYRMIDRAKATTPEEAREILLQHFASDCFFMSANAITRKGELVNIDGNSNRLACLLHGPREVYVLVGMNKVVEDVDAGIKRIHTMACPAQRRAPAHGHALRAHRRLRQLPRGRMYVLQRGGNAPQPPSRPHQGDLDRRGPWVLNVSRLSETHCA